LQFKIVYMLLSVLLKALPIGLILSFAPGAAFFSVIQTSISRGFKSGFFLALGISLSDTFLVILCLLGLGGIMENNETAQLIMGIIGGAVLILFGGYTLFNKKSDLNPVYNQSLKLKKEKIEQIIENKSENNRFKYIMKGFIINVTNPFVWILWLSIVPNTGTIFRERALVLLVILATILSADIIKSFFAGKIKKVLTPLVIFYINRIVGLIVAVLGIALIIRVFVIF
jgi:threonine/homoserine/homoserine lactone efflux protein